LSQGPAQKEILQFCSKIRHPAFMTALAQIRAKYLVLSGYLDERARRIWAAAEAKSLGYGCATLVQTATGIACSTIRRGCAEIESDTPLAIQRIRQSGEGASRLLAMTLPFPRNVKIRLSP
jgi:hypothetical protein